MVFPKFSELRLLKLTENQVRPFHINTSDGEMLYGWHILPVALYTRHEATLVQEEHPVVKPFESSKGFQLLSDDQESRLVISC